MPTIAIYICSFEVPVERYRIEPNGGEAIILTEANSGIKEIAANGVFERKAYIALASTGVESTKCVSSQCRR